jgi:IS1 family transposase
MRKSKKTSQIHQLSIAQFESMFPDEEACCAYLAGNRWPEGVKCPRCGNANVHEHSSMPWHWQCYVCSPGNVGYRFSVLVGTIFENTNKELREWFRVIHLMLTSKKGISALQVMRYMGFGSYKTAWLICHKVRAAMQDVGFRKLIGIVEVDETYVGGKARNQHKGPGGRGDMGGTGGSGKSVVVGAIKRKGNVVARVIDRADTATLNAFVNEALSDKVSLICTDEWSGYGKLPPEYPHGIIRHSTGSYVHGNIHTNTIEGFWSIFKRGIVGTFHKVSKRYLPLYVAEFKFRYNNRKNDDIFDAAVRAC